MLLHVAKGHRSLSVHSSIPFGGSAAPSIFQRIMESLLKGILNVFMYLDDILVTGGTDAEHLQNFRSVLDCRHETQEV